MVGSHYFPPAFDPEGFDREVFHVEMNEEVPGFLKRWMN